MESEKACSYMKQMIGTPAYMSQRHWPNSVTDSYTVVYITQYDSTGYIWHWLSSIQCVQKEIVIFNFNVDLF